MAKQSYPFVSCFLELCPAEPIFSAPAMFWWCVCKDHNITFSWPMSLENGRSLLKALLQTYEPETAKFFPVDQMAAGVLKGHLFAMAKKYILPKLVVSEKPKPEESKSEASKKATKSEGDKLRRFALWQIAINGGREAEEAAREVLRIDPNLEPKRHDDSRASKSQSLLKEVRADDLKISRFEEAAALVRKAMFTAFMNELDERGQAWIVLLSRLLMEINPLADSDTKAANEMLDAWFNFAESLLGPKIFANYIALGMPVKEGRIIQGIALDKTYFERKVHLPN